MKGDGQIDCAYCIVISRAKNATREARSTVDRSGVIGLLLSNVVVWAFRPPSVLRAS